MTRHHLTAEGDFVQRLKLAVIPSIAELIWNGLDADATIVDVALDRNGLGGIDRVIVTDNGLGMSPDQAELTFSRLGGSPKKLAPYTESGRRVHGSEGQGRFACLGFATRVTWTSVARDIAGVLFRTTVTIDAESPQSVDIDYAPLDAEEPTGTRVVAVVRELRPRQIEGAADVLTGLLALHLEQYPVLTVTVDDWKLDTASCKIAQTEYGLPIPASEPEHGRPTLVVLEWNRSFPRALVLCDQAGSSIMSLEPGIHARGFDFTAYLRWEGFRSRGHDLAIVDPESEVGQLIDAAKDELRSHFKRRSAGRRAELLASWHDEGAYPYAEEPADDVEVAERQIFDVVAITAEPALRASDTAGRRLSLSLIKAALRSSPEALTNVLTEVLKLGKDELEDLNTMLRRSTLPAIIAASKTVTDRLEFLNYLPTLLFDPALSPEVLETRHLHRLLAEHTWVFGEEFALMADDEGLTTVLRRHLAELGRDELVDAPVLLDDGRQARVDLCMGRADLDSQGRREHLVVELKRPTCMATKKEYDQIVGYADAVARDHRFAHSDVRWQFWLVVNDVDDWVQRRMTQEDRPFGLVERSKDYEVWVKPWSRVLAEAAHRMAFIKDALAYEASQDEGLLYLREAYERYLPGAIGTPGTTSD